MQFEVAVRRFALNSSEDFQTDIARVTTVHGRLPSGSRAAKRSRAKIEPRPYVFFQPAALLKASAPLSPSQLLNRRWPRASHCQEGRLSPECSPLPCARLLK